MADEYAEQLEQLQKMYPSMTPAPAPADNKPVLRNGLFVKPTASVTPQSQVDKTLDEARANGESVTSASDELLAQKFYPQGADAGEPLTNYEHLMSSVFDPLELESRSIHDDGTLAEISTTKDALNQVFVDYSVGQSAAQRLMSAARDHIHVQRSADSIAQLTESTMATLRKEEGSRTDGLIKGANRVVAEMVRRVPKMKALMDNGLGSNPVFVRSMINIAKQRGYCQ